MESIFPTPFILKLFINYREGKNAKFLSCAPTKTTPAREGGSVTPRGARWTGDRETWQFSHSQSLCVSSLQSGGRFARSSSLRQFIEQVLRTQRTRETHSQWLLTRPQPHELRLRPRRPPPPQCRTSLQGFVPLQWD